MSLLTVNCPATLSVRDVLRLVSDIDVSNRIHIRTITDPGAILSPLVTCDNKDMSAADILRGAMVLDSEDGNAKLLISE